MQNKLFQVADRILDQTYLEKREENLASTNTVQAFALDGLNVNLTDAEAFRILTVCEEWVERDTFGTSDDYYRIVKVPLFR